MSQTQFSPRIRIERIELQNFKGVKGGIVEFNCLKTPVEKDTCSDILGIYGQNGSGKTTLLEALHVAKLAMMGKEIPFDRFGNAIAQGADSARISIVFQVSNPDNSFYHLEYAFSLVVLQFLGSETKSYIKTSDGRKGIAAAMGGAMLLPAALGAVPGLGLIPAVAGAAGVVATQILQSSESGKERSSADGTVKLLVIKDEVLNLSGMFNGLMIRFGPVIDTRTEETVFLPKARQKSFNHQKTASVMKELQKYKNRTQYNSKSFIFGDDLSQLLLEQETITEYAQIIMDLKAFAIQKLLVLDTKVIGASGQEIIPLYTANCRIGVRKSDSTTFLNEKGLQMLQTALKGLSVVLKQLIPGMTLEAVRQVDIDLDDERNTRVRSKGTKVLVYTVRDNVRIPIAEESAGIIRLISIIGLLSYAFANQNVTVAIDEIDAGVYEYLLGELLLVFEEYGSGQLIFTCHNLRPMEVLNKKYIYFTTTNSENRYLKPKSIRNENNLRDVYLREIVMGGQEEELYSAAKHGKLASAFQKAGEIIGQE